MTKVKNYTKVVAFLLCAIMLFSAVPMFRAEAAAPATGDYTWGYPEATKATADAGTLDVAWIRGEYYGTGAENISTPEGVIANDRNYCRTEVFAVPAGMKIWWFGPAVEPGVSPQHGEYAPITFWDKTGTVYSAYYGFRNHSSSWETDRWSGSKYMQSMAGSANGICYTYWNESGETKYIKLSAKMSEFSPIYYSMGYPELMGEDGAALPRAEVTGVTWEKNKRQFESSGAVAYENSAQGYMTSSLIAVKAGYTIALFGDRTYNNYTSEDSQMVHDKPTLTFAAYTDSAGKTYSSANSINIESAKIQTGPINDTGVVVYQYTNTTKNTLYIRVSCCCTNQPNKNVMSATVFSYAPMLDMPSNTAAPSDTYKAIRTNTDEVVGYFTSVDPAMNATVRTPSTPPATKGGYFLGWKVAYNTSSGAKTEFYPSDTTLELTKSETVRTITSEISMSPVYVDAPPVSYAGASVRCWMPTGLQFKLYFLYSDFEKMQDLADKTKGSLSVGAFAVPQLNFDTFLSANSIKLQDGTAATTTAAVKDQTLNSASATAFDENFTMAWFKNYAKTNTLPQNPAYINATAQGGYVATETIDSVKYCVTYFTIADSAKTFTMHFAVRPYMSVQYVKADGTFGYSEPLYGTFKTSNVRNTDEVLYQTLSMRTETDFLGVRYFSTTKSDVQNNTNGLYGNNRFPVVSLTYYDPTSKKNITIYSRKFTGATFAELERILVGTYYDPNPDTRRAK